MNAWGLGRLGTSTPVHTTTQLETSDDLTRFVPEYFGEHHHQLHQCLHHAENALMDWVVMLGGVL
jgi:hypothetical protein